MCRSTTRIDGFALREKHDNIQAERSDHRQSIVSQSVNQTIDEDFFPLLNSTPASAIADRKLQRQDTVPVRNRNKLL